MLTSHEAAAGDFLGVGLANDIYEPSVAEYLSDRFVARDIGYYEFYLYKDSDRPEYLANLRAALPEALPKVWHCGGEFELAYPGRTYESFQSRFHMLKEQWQPRWCLEDIATITFGFSDRPPTKLVPLVPPPLTDVCLEIVIDNTVRAKSLCPVPFYPELPYFPVPVGGSMTLPRFMSELVERANTDVVFDIGHYISWNLLDGRAYDALVDEFPWEHVAEIHVGGGYVGESDGRVWIDDHSAPIHPLQVKILERVMNRCPRLRGLLLELVHTPRELIRYSLDLVKPIVQSYKAGAWV